MKYPKLLKNKDTIGIVALSCGVGRKLPLYKKSLQTIKTFGYNIKETKSVRKNALIAASAPQRVKELNSLLTNKDVKAILCASGGDFQYETHPYINYDLISKNLKWIMGYSDPTNFLYPVTCKCDIATIYGYNGSSFSNQYLSEFETDFFDFLSTGKLSYKSSSKHEKLDYKNEAEPILNTKTVLDGSCNTKGRVIGGCFETINDMAGAKYDYTSCFINRYSKEGIIWFFDIYGITSTALYLGLLRMKSLGYFKNTKAILVGRVLYENENNNLTYKQAFKKALKNIPVILNTDIGHTYPSMPIILGSTLKVKVAKGKGTFDFILN